MSKDHLGEFEELVLLLVVLLKDQAYGLSIRKALQEHANRTATIGAVHNTVNRLEDKGFIQSSLGGASEERGGRRKRLFAITAAGSKMLEKTRDAKVSLWNKIPELTLDTPRN
ncbi:MAG: PadR family transcriptional regulator PadR [Cyclobacteriaceae bacterium]|jgi:PadR family transcriptional regulator PadR